MRIKNSTYIKIFLIFIAILPIIFLDVKSIIEYLLENEEDIIYLSVEHIKLTYVSGFFATIFAILSGIILSRSKVLKYSEYILQVYNTGMAIPTLAVLAIAMLVMGIGFAPAFFALFIISIIPITRNIYTALKNVPDFYLHAGCGVGMSAVELFFKVEFPNSMPLMFSGIRTAMSINIGTAPLATLIGASTLGDFIFTGIMTDDIATVMLGASLSALIAILTDLMLSFIYHLVTPNGVKRDSHQG